MESNFAKSAYRNFMFWGICSSLGVSVSTLIDAILVGNFVGSDGLAVANIATPVFLAYALFGTTIGIGANVLIGQMLGANRVDEANRLFNTQIIWGLALSMVILICAVCSRDGLLRFLGASGALTPLAEGYLTVVFYFAPVFIVYHILAVSVRTDSEPRLAAAASATVIVTNLVLDLLFMKGLNWGILGASISLCIAEGLGMLVLLTHFFKKRALLRFCFGSWRLDLGALRGFLKNGFGVGSAYIFQAVVTLAFNTLLLSCADGVTFVAIFGVLYTMSTVSFAVFDGAGNALSAVVSILSGERDGGGMRIVLHQGIKTAVVGGALITAVFFVGAEHIAAFFGLVSPVMEQAALALRVFSGSILLSGINMVVTAFWQTTDRARLAGTVSIARNFAFMLVLGAVLIPKYQIIGLAAAYICSEALCLLGVVTVSLTPKSRNYIAEHYPPGSRMYEKYYSIEEQSVAQISRDLTQLCDAWEVDPRRAMFINLIAEELLLNIIKFGLNDTERPHYISVKLLDDEEDYIIRIRDNVSSYNPFEADGDDVDMAVIKMISAKTKRCDYQRKLIFNYLYLVI